MAPLSTGMYIGLTIVFIVVLFCLLGPGGKSNASVKTAKTGSRHATLRTANAAASVWRARDGGYSAVRAAGGDPIDWLSMKRGAVVEQLS